MGASISPIHFSKHSFAPSTVWPFRKRLDQSLANGIKRAAAAPDRPDAPAWPGLLGPIACRLPASGLPRRTSAHSRRAESTPILPAVCSTNARGSLWVKSEVKYIALEGIVLNYASADQQRIKDLVEQVATKGSSALPDQRTSISEDGIDSLEPLTVEHGFRTSGNAHNLGGCGDCGRKLWPHFYSLLIKIVPGEPSYRWGHRVQPSVC